MTDNDRLSAAIATFARYGFRKTSMEDVARAMGLSRQALYKKYASKEVLYRALIEGLVLSTQDQAVTILQDSTQSLDKRLLDAFDIWAGQHVDLMRASPHSAEVIDFTDANMREISLQAEQAIAAAIVKALGRRTKRHEDIAFTLLMASKGLMMKAQSRDDFLKGMARAIAVTIPG